MDDIDDMDDMDDDTTTAGLDDAATSVVRISAPADILGVLPYRIGFHPSESLVVVCLEESGLEKRFGESYREYRRNVPRWLPRFRPWSGGEPSPNPGG